MNKIQIPWEDRPVGCTDGRVGTVFEGDWYIERNFWFCRFRVRFTVGRYLCI